MTLATTVFPAVAVGLTALIFQYGGIRMQRAIIDNTDSEIEKQISKFALSVLCGILTAGVLYGCFPHLRAVTYVSTGLISMTILYLLTGFIRNEG